jgi:NAD+ kinase
VHNIKVELTDQKIKTVKLKNNSFWHKVQRNFL